ncbi:MFS general substrate transporter [Calocera cornea HHB12733]|uniref:MFS general substrate transporter n=1 Tax=Calocera cornea HHB12733 TaxID=1353952 RepID=A0A165HKF0_9BASI|nr:MFS general substrate transporter [Calocera cornea HHB12733]
MTEPISPSKKILDSLPDEAAAIDPAVGITQPVITDEEKKVDEAGITLQPLTPSQDVDERSGAIPSGVQGTEPDIYDRFSPRRKLIVVFIIAWAALLAPFASSAFLPSIPQIASDLRTTESVINYSVAVYLVVIAFAPLAWSRASTYYGRRPVYLASMPVFVLGSVGVAESRTLAELIITRIIQGAGASSVLSIGAGSIGDIYRPTERGRAMGWYLAGAQFGPPLAPVVGGLMTEYVHGSRGTWRAFQYLLAGMGLATFLLVLVFLPETAHQTEQHRLKTIRQSDGTGQMRVTFKDVWAATNPLQPLAMLRHPKVALITANSAFVMLTTYCILVPMPYTLGPRFNITNAAVNGCLYLAQGIGNIGWPSSGACPAAANIDVVGSYFTGYISDWTVHRWMTRRNGERICEDRLEASYWAGAAATPLTLLAAGLLMQFWTTAPGLAICLIVLFINGIALIGVLAVCNTYLVDSYQARSTEVIAANNCIRYIASAGASAAVLPLMQAIGIAPTNAIAAGLAWAGFICVWLVRRRAPPLRRVSLDEERGGT